ncbi:DUF58 domain-containing protein [Microbacterium sp.]|uniref:DUF58 domain-containing protein n=1 Tax=Microbacterium sp. TaxID=51671 RepID=UPI0039E46426
MKTWPLTLRGTGAVVFGVASFFLAHAITVAELLYVGTLLFMAVAISLASLYLTRRTESVVRFFEPEVATVRRPVRVRARVEIRSALPTMPGTWRDTVRAGLSGDATGTFPATASGMGAAPHPVDLEYTVDPQRRGIHSIGPLRVTSTDPFGFARRRHEIGGAVPLVVAPAVVELGPLSELPGEAGGSMHSATNQLGQGADNLIPRHYVPGDSMRRIHWRASAHRDELMVRQEEQETTPEAVVVLDRSVQRWTPDAMRAPGDDPGFETGVTACVSAAARLVREGYLVHVIDVDGHDLTEPMDAADSGATLRLAADFATVVAQRDVPLEQLVRQFAGTVTGPLVLVTGALSPADAAALGPLAHHSTLPVLLAVAPQHDALARCAAAGWQTGFIPPDADLAAAWNAAIDRGASRVGA